MIFKQENSQCCTFGFSYVIKIVQVYYWFLRALLLKAHISSDLVYIHFQGRKYNCSVYPTAHCRLLRILGLFCLFVLLLK